jgi:hypothetical protein
VSQKSPSIHVAGTQQALANAAGNHHSVILYPCV